MPKGNCLKCKKYSKQLIKQYKTIKNKRKYIGGKCKNCNKNKTRKSIKKALKKFKGGFYEKPVSNEPVPITPEELTNQEIPTEKLTLDQQWDEFTGDNIDDAGAVVFSSTPGEASVDYYGGDVEGKVNKLDDPDDPTVQETPGDEQKGGKRFKKHYMYTKKGKRYIAKTRKQHLKGVKLGHKHKKPKISRKKRR